VERDPAWGPHVVPWEGDPEMLQYFITLLTVRRERDEAGASAVEYGLLVVGVAAAVAAALLLLGPALLGLFGDVAAAIN
jgi:pilus assembly protein Flp/PilA